MTRVLVVDDHRIFADLLAFSLDAEDDFVCVGRARTIAEAIALSDSLLPDVVVMDIGLPDGDGVEATSRILQRHPHVRVLILTGNVDQNVFARAAQAGAVAFLAKYGGLDEVLATLRAAHSGAVVVNRELLSELVSQAPQPMPPVEGPVLTAREREVLELLAEGSDVQRIAQVTATPVSSCRGQIKSLREKLDAHSQLEVVVKAYRAGLLPRASAGAAGYTRPPGS